ncbi:MAG: DMT family transporter [Acidocella sp.]|nr:DMT family transporter [Acidocella sp.]
MSVKSRALALTFVAVLLWGCAPVGTRFMVGTDHSGVAALPFIGLRYFVAAVCFSPWLLRALRGWSRRDLAMGALCGLIGITGYNLPNALGTRTVSAGMVGLLNGSEPLMIVVLSALRAHRAPRGWTILASVIGLAGIILLAHGAGPALGSVGGITLILLSAFLWSVYCVLIPGLMARRGALAVTAVTMAAGSLPMFLAGLPGMTPMVAHFTAAQWEIYLALTFGTSVVAMLFWNLGTAGLGAEQAGWFLYLLPVVSLLGGVVFLGEPLQAVEFFGGGLIMLSVVLSRRAIP